MIDTQTDESLHALKALRDALAEKLQRESADFRTFQALTDAISLLHSGAGKGTGAASGPETTMRRRGRKPFDPPMDGDGKVRRFVSQREAAERALLGIGAPLTIKDLLNEVARHGAVVGGIRPQATLSSNLSQDPRFILVPFAGRLCWWLADQPVPEDTSILAASRQMAPSEAMERADA